MGFNDYLSKINSKEETARHYFAAANTKDGFYSLFDEIFGCCSVDKLYILKGGPGCGKSTCIKNISKKANELGFCPIEYHCSSDPYSLDGVFVPEKKIAVIDGTLPHAKEPTAAGITEIIVDLGTSWDTAGLYLNKAQLLSLIKEKSQSYNIGYRFLCALGKMNECMDEIIKNAVLTEKMKQNAQRLVLKMGIKKDRSNVQNKTVFTRAISGAGKVRLFTFENMSKNIYFIKDDYITAKYFLLELKNAAIPKNIEFTQSKNPLCPDDIDGLYFPDSDTCFTLYDEDFCRMLDAKGNTYKVINMKRFVDKEKILSKRQTLRFCKKCAGEFEKAAILNLKQAMQTHAKLESIYSLYTDYDRVENCSNQLEMQVYGK